MAGVGIGVDVGVGVGVDLGVGVGVAIGAGVGVYVGVDVGVDDGVGVASWRQSFQGFKCFAISRGWGEDAYEGNQPVEVSTFNEA